MVNNDFFNFWTEILLQKILHLKSGEKSGKKNKENKVVDMK